MYHFDYVSKKEAAPYKAGLIELLNKVQDYVRDEFTFQFTFIGSSSRNMITYDTKTIRRKKFGRSYTTHLLVL